MKSLGLRFVMWGSGSARLPSGVKTGRKHPWAFFVEDQLGVSTLYVVGEHAAVRNL